MIWDSWDTWDSRDTKTWNKITEAAYYYVEAF